MKGPKALYSLYETVVYERPEGVVTIVHKEVKIDFFDRFFGEKSVFGWVGNEFGKEKSEIKKSEKNRQFFR